MFANQTPVSICLEKHRRIAASMVHIFALVVNGTLWRKHHHAMYGPAGRPPEAPQTHTHSVKASCRKAKERGARAWRRCCSEAARKVVLCEPRSMEVDDEEEYYDPNEEDDHLPINQEDCWEVRMHSLARFCAVCVCVCGCWALLS